MSQSPVTTERLAILREKTEHEEFGGANRVVIELLDEIARLRSRPFAIGAGQRWRTWSTGRLFEIEDVVDDEVRFRPVIGDELVVLSRRTFLELMAPVLD